MLMHVFSYDIDTGLAYASPASCAYDKKKPLFQVYSKRPLKTNMTYSFKSVIKYIGSVLVRHEMDYNNGSITNS